jgi:hypothetical protein
MVLRCWYRVIYREENEIGFGDGSCGKCRVEEEEMEIDCCGCVLLKFKGDGRAS